jgi:Fe-S-cluster containining protein
VRLPAIAKQAYDRLKDGPHFAAILKRVERKLQKLKRTQAKVEFIHRELDLAIEKVFRDPAVKQHVQCSKGCSHCCHSLIGITEEEAELYATMIKRGEVEVDLSLLSFQANVVENSRAWYQLPFSQRACPFLDSQTQQCKIYDQRPAVCRTTFALSEPERCAGDKGPIRSLKTDEASMILIAAFQDTGKSGEIQKMLWEKLDTSSQQVLPLMHRSSISN